MNYARHYEGLMNRASARCLVGYVERHHIVPRCMGGGDEPENLVDLTPEEHYVAHQLLVKMYPYVRHLASAAVWMSKQCTGNKAFGWLRRKSAADISQSMRGNKNTLGKKLPPRSAEHCEKISAAKRGHKLSERQKAEISEFQKGRKKPPYSAVALENIRAAAKARRGKPAHNKGVPHTAQARAKMSAALRGRAISPEWAAKIAAANRGRRYPPRSAEWSAAISSAKKGKPGTPCSLETRAKLSVIKRSFYANRAAA